MGLINKSRRTHYLKNKKKTECLIFKDHNYVSVSSDQCNRSCVVTVAKAGLVTKWL
jgi:hypothetical protein